MGARTTNHETPLVAWIEAARGKLARLEGPGESTWRELIDRGFADAYAFGDIQGLTRVVQLLTNLLEFEGRFDAVVAEVDAAIAVAAGDFGAEAALLALKATMLPPLGQVTAAGPLAQKAASLASEHLSGESRIQALARAETVRLVVLDEPSSSLSAVLTELVAARDHSNHLFVLSWLVPYLAARGNIQAAQVYVRRTRAVASSEQAALRVADADVFERWLALAGGKAMLVSGEVNRQAHIPAWRNAWLDLWAALLHRNFAAGEMAAQAVRRRAVRLGRHTGDPGAAAIVLAAAKGAPFDPPPPTPPANLTLDNLPANAAVAAAVAIGGTSASAASWFDWTTKVRRRGIASSLEFPVSLARIHGLLALRLGKTAVARKYLVLASESNPDLFAVEAPIAAVQAEELRLKMGAGPAGAGKSDGRNRLLGLNIDPVPVQYVVHQAWDAGRSAEARPLLTPREVDVLRQMAIGRSYKEAALELGIAWKTVQTLAHRTYEKLAVSNRVEAIAEGHKLGLL